MKAKKPIAFVRMSDGEVFHLNEDKKTYSLDLKVTCSDGSPAIANKYDEELFSSSSLNFEPVFNQYIMPHTIFVKPFCC